MKNCRFTCTELIYYLQGYKIFPVKYKQKLQFETNEAKVVNILNKQASRQGCPIITRSDNVTFGYWLSQKKRKSVCRVVQCCLSVTFMHPTPGFETFGNSSSSFCTLAIIWRPCKISRRSSQGNLSIGHGRGR